MMDIKRCAAFVAAVETKSMSGAAKQLGYTPSGIIRLINALESELGFPLLDRSSTGVSATAEGAKMLPILKEICRLDDLAQQTSARIRGLAEGTLTIGVIFSLASEWLPPVIDAYQKRFPGVNVNIVGGSDVVLREKLDQHAIDCAIFHGDHSKLDWIPLGRQELMAWEPLGSPLNRHSELLLAELDGQPFIRIHPEGETFAERLLRERGIEPDFRFTANDCYTAYSMVSAGLGFTLCCDGISDRWEGDVVVRPLSPRQFLEFGIAVQPVPGLSPAVEEFIAIAKTFANVWPNRPLSSGPTASA